MGGSDGVSWSRLVAIASDYAEFCAASGVVCTGEIPDRRTPGACQAKRAHNFRQIVNSFDYRDLPYPSPDFSYF